MREGWEPMGTLGKLYAWARDWRNGLVLRALNTAWQSAVVAYLAAPHDEFSWSLIGAAVGAGLSAVKTLLVSELRP